MKEKDYSDKLLKVQKDYMRCQQGMMEVMSSDGYYTWNGHYRIE